MSLEIPDERAGAPEPRGQGVLEPAPSSPPAEWWLDRGLAEQLYTLVERHDLSSPMAEDVIAGLARDHGDLVYAELIFLLTRLRLDPADARRHWPGVLARQAEIGSRAGRAGDIRVALLSYFLDVDRQLERPKVVEMTWVERTAASALLDDVTGLPNQRFFRAQLGREVERSLQHNSPLSLLVLDVDDFKRVNDLLGHDTGTATLRDLAKLLRAQARASDLIVRYGGDEFVVLLPATPKPDAARVAETLRTTVKSYRVQRDPESAPLAVTFSMGVATCPADARSGSDLFIAADRALYDAKKAGKDCVRLCGESVRSYARRKAVWPAWVDPAGASGYSVETLEVSEGGLSFRSERDLPIGTVFEAKLTTPDGQTLRVVGRVVRSRAEAPMRHEIAARFLEPGGSDREHLARWVCSA